MKSIEQLSPLTESSYYVLLSFLEENHGYGVIKLVKEMTSNRLVLAPGTLYGVITSLLKHDLIVLKDIKGGRSKKTYNITDTGKLLLQYEINRLKEMYENGMEVLK